MFDGATLMLDEEALLSSIMQYMALKATSTFPVIIGKGSFFDTPICTDTPMRVSSKSSRAQRPINQPISKSSNTVTSKTVPSLLKLYMYSKCVRFFCLEIKVRDA